MENSRRKIFIGGLPANITETQLKEHFAKYGTVGFLFLFFYIKHLILSQYSEFYRILKKFFVSFVIVFLCHYSEIILAFMG